MTDLEARQIHEIALEAQEKGDFIKALQLEVQAMVLYQKAGDQKGFAEIQAMFFLTYRHLYEQTGDEGYLSLAKHAAMVSVELAQKSGDKTALAIPYFNLAKAQETLGQDKEALETFREAVDNILNNPPDTHDKEAVKLDFQIHLFTAEIKNGNSSFKEKALSALKKLETAQGTTDYERGVWLSGGYMRLAACLKETEPEQAKKYLQKAKEIIDQDARLNLRLKQWEKLAKSFTTLGVVVTSILLLR